MSRPMMLSALLVCGLAALPAVAQTGEGDPTQSGPPSYGGPQEYYQSQPPVGSPGQPAPQQGGGSRAARFVAMFHAANTTNDGRLTLQQAQAANLTPVVKHFVELDPTNKGYVTIQDIRSYIQRMRAMRAQQNVNE